MGYGFGRIESVYFINLKHRNDRLDNILYQLNKVNISYDKITRIDAIYNKFFGILGCGKSHIKALETFINRGKGDYCLIFEDDFEFISNIDINNIIESFFDSIGDNFDVLMLASNVLQDEETNFPFIRRIIDAQTLSGYCVNRKYAETLLENFKTGVYMLETLGYSEHDYCVDIHVKKLQRKDRWFYITPKIGKQMESFSDIERTKINYNC